MSDHSPEPWKPSMYDDDRVLAADNQLLAVFHGGKEKREANKLLFLAAPAMKRELAVAALLLKGDTVMLDRRRQWQADNIYDLLATTEPAGPPTLLESCVVILAHAVGLRQNGTADMLRKAIEAEQARTEEAT